MQCLDFNLIFFVKSDEPDIAIVLGLTNVRLHGFSCWVHASLVFIFAVRWLENLSESLEIVKRHLLDTIHSNMRQQLRE